MKTTPAQLQEDINKISDDVFEANMEYAGIAEREGEAKLDLMRESKSAVECEMKYNATADGRRGRYLKYYIRGLLAKRGALMLEAKTNAGWRV